MSPTLREMIQGVDQKFIGLRQMIQTGYAGNEVDWTEFEKIVDVSEIPDVLKQDLIDFEEGIYILRFNHEED